ncbi:DNA-directed DNA polymerase II small subunit [Candidatus Bathyarchaeota archaeon A05DMB-2]|jgi:DNA polymerase II small subunit|nr:DNA-directed DNA polymerase II small subunit [Candidatus Bathyarchaeota archaeon A05DMB-2]
MGEQERLQKAVETTIAAGYQLNREAFELLRTAAATSDPTAIINNALQRIEELDEKPVFIDRSFLETLLTQTEAAKEAQVQTQLQEEETEENPETYVTEGGSPFHPYAKDVEAKINVLEDPTGKLSSNGTIEEYLQYFQDRFKRIERLLRQRIDVRAATPITEALKSAAKTKLKIIGMVAEKREAKKQMMLTIEDLQASANILISHNAPEELHRKARNLIPDQVVCVAVVKTRSNLFLAEDIIFPEVGQKPQRRATEPVYAVLTSDIHVGSTKFNRDSFNRFILWLNGKYGNEQMKKIAGHVKYVLIAGDIVDGVGVYPNQINELVIKDAHKQYKLASKLIEQIPDYIEVVVSPGNHDASRNALPQPAISEDFLGTLKEKRKIRSLGNPCLVSLHNVEVLMYHGRSLDDVIGSVPGLTHEHPEKAMKLLLQSRHLAPLYGGKTMLSPESRDFLVMDRVPDIFHSGHVHVVGCCNYRGVLVVNSGGWQEQTEYMEKLGLMPTPGKVPVVNLQTLETTILSFL